MARQPLTFIQVGTAPFVHSSHAAKALQTLPDVCRLAGIVEEAPLRERAQTLPEFAALPFLPPVSPQLNPIERLWKKIKTDFFHNRIHDGIEDVKASVAKALATLTAMVVASICACSYLDACL